MPTEPKKPLIVISYAHADEPEHPAEGEVKWLSFVTGYLRPAIKHGAVDFWLDRLMPGGTDWEREIAQKLHACDIFILLVSRHSLSSDYVVDTEIKIIRERQTKAEAVHFYPLVLTPTPEIALDLVRDKNLRPLHGKPLSDFSLSERYRQMSNAADEIADITGEIVERADRRFSSTHKPLETTFIHNEGRNDEFSDVKDRNSASSFLAVHNRRFAVVTAVRASVRVLPLIAKVITTKYTVKSISGSSIAKEKEVVNNSDLSTLASVLFRITALARVVEQYATKADKLPAAVMAAYEVANDAQAGDVGLAIAKAASTATSRVPAASAADAVEASAEVAFNITTAVAAEKRDAGQTVFAYSSEQARASVWGETRVDALKLQASGPQSVNELPLWSLHAPDWFRDSWSDLQDLLPKEEGWQVWIDWYEQRLRGGSPGEDYELVFASVPEEEWEKGPAAVNIWIKTHLPSAPAFVQPVGLPAPLPNLDKPFAYGWTATQHVAVVAGAQNLPFYPHVSSEEDHRHALEACQVGGERLLKALRDGRYNARPEYGEALEYYLEDLPKTAGAGNILIANDQARILHAMFLADAALLPEGFASRLKSVIANQFALNAFYDLVQRHNEAVSAGNWTQPFPLEAAKSFFGAVEDNTPRWFEPEVEQGLRQVEHAEPPPAATPEQASVPASASAIEPPPLPPGTPDAQNSWRRQMATAANALWETFLQGQDMPVAHDEWHKAADELGTHVRPIIEFLREQ